MNIVYTIIALYVLLILSLWVWFLLLKRDLEVKKISKNKARKINKILGDK